MLNRYRQVSEGQEKGEKGESSFFFFLLLFLYGLNHCIYFFFSFFFFNDLIQLKMYYTNPV